MSTNSNYTRNAAKLEANRLLVIASEADKAFSTALVATYGKRNAGTIRYLPSRQTPEIKALGDSYKDKIEAWRIAYRAIPSEEVQS